MQYKRPEAGMRGGLLIDERAFNQEIAAHADFGRFDQAEIVQYAAGVFQHRGAAAQHGAVVLRVDFGQADVFKQFADAGGDACSDGKIQGTR